MISIILSMTMQCMNVFVRLKHPMLTRSSNSKFPYMCGFGAVLLIGYLSKGIDLFLFQPLYPVLNISFNLVFKVSYY